MLLQALRGEPTSARSQLLDFLMSPEAWQAWNNSASESVVHKAFYPHASKEVRLLLERN